MQYIKDIDALLAEMGATATKTPIGKGTYEYVIEYSDIFMKDLPIGVRARFMFIGAGKPWYCRVNATLRQIYDIYRKFSTLNPNMLVDYRINVKFDTFVDIVYMLYGRFCSPTKIAHTLMQNIHTDFGVILYHISRFAFQSGVLLNDIANSTIISLCGSGLYNTAHIRRYLQLHQNMRGITMPDEQPQTRERLYAIEVQNREFALSLRERALSAPMLWNLRVIIRNGAANCAIAFICLHAFLHAHGYNDSEIWAIVHGPVEQHFGSIMARRRKFGG